MSVDATADVVASKALHDVPNLSGGSSDSDITSQLLRSIGAYIPTEITTMYIAVAGGMAQVEGLSGDVKMNVAVLAALLAGFAIWVRGHQKTAELAKKKKKSPPNLLRTGIAGWYEIMTAAVALFAWATAMPSSWFAWGQYGAFGPVALVSVASFLIGGVAVLLNRSRA